ncbi:glycosyl hydrolase family 61-domain-containing protein [Abortiporus biennis]|nr:glycosyl hydrolase family 61-domain-containing protein [Abortiporus biennis]
MKLLSTAFLLFSALLPTVYAHGFVGQVAIDGKWYAGNVPGDDNPGESPIRQISDIGPVKGASNQDLRCGLSAQKASMVVNANPGSKYSIQWSGGAGQKWPHNTGPLMTYMASCGSTSCDQYDPDGDTKWFKIDQLGKESDGSTWYQQDVMQGDAYTITLPSNLSPGGYLIRHEIIALHLATSMGGAEFYPSCTQVMIGGNGNGQPNGTVAFPGAYSDSDPGIYDPNVYDPGSPYVFPGGPLSNLVATDGTMSNGQSSSAAFPSGTAAPSASPHASSTAGGASPSAQPTSSSSQSGGAQCRLQRRDTSGLQPRHYSRIMRRLLHHTGFGSS